MRVIPSTRRAFLKTAGTSIAAVSLNASLFAQERTANAAAAAPIKVVIAGLVHGHVSGFLKKAYQGSVEIVGIYETNREVANKYRDRYHFADTLFGADLPKMLEERKP